MLWGKGVTQSASGPHPDLCPNYSWVSFFSFVTKIKLLQKLSVCDLDSSLSFAVIANALNDLLALSTRSTDV